MTTLLEWAQQHGAIPETAIASQREHEEAAVHGLFSVLAIAVGKQPRVFRRDAVSKSLLSWANRLDPQEDAVSLWRKLTIAATVHLPSLEDAEVDVTTVQRVTMPSGQPQPEWIKRTGVVVTVKGPSGAQHIAVFLADA